MPSNAAIGRNIVADPADGRPQLLIVDDDPLITEAFGYVLEKDFRVIVTDTRAAAIRSIRALAEPPPLALVDLGLPPTPHRPDEGFALISELLAHVPDMRIIVLSGQSELAHARHARTLGALEYLAKPVDPERLGKLLQSALSMDPAAPSECPVTPLIEVTAGPGIPNSVAIACASNRALIGAVSKVLGVGL